MPDDTAFWEQINRALLTASAAIKKYKLKESSEAAQIWQRVKEEAVKEAQRNGYSTISTTPEQH